MTAPTPVTAPATTSASSLRGGFNRLWSAAIASNLADGVGRTAVPLIATTLTRDPALIAGISAVAFLPWLFFGILLDRVDRRIAMAVANCLRFAVAALLAALIATDTLTIWWLYACVMLFGMGETVFDNATTTVVPSLVGRDRLESANGRMQSAEIVVQDFIATPIAGFLFAAAIALPVWLTGSGFLVSALLALAIPAAAAHGAVRAGDPRTGDTNASDDTDASGASGETHTHGTSFGSVVAFLLGHRFLRDMILLTSLTASALAFAQGSVVLLLLQTFQVPPAAIGLATATIGAGALAGALLASRLVRRFGRGPVMFTAILASGAGMVGVGPSGNVFVALACYAVGALGIGVWNVPWGALRQAIVPEHMLGRAIGIIRTIGWGLTPIATVLGGFVARIDLRLPFVIGGGAVVVLALVAARLLLSATRAAPPATLP